MQSTKNSKGKTKRVKKDSNPAPAPLETVSNENVVEEKTFTYRSSLNLKRSFLNGDIKHCKFICKEDAFRSLIIVGIKNGVTWDEVLRALIDRELVSNEPFSGIENYL